MSIKYTYECDVCSHKLEHILDSNLPKGWKTGNIIFYDIPNKNFYVCSNCYPESEQNIDKEPYNEPSQSLKNIFKHFFKKA